MKKGAKKKGGRKGAAASQEEEVVAETVEVTTQEETQTQEKEEEEVVVEENVNQENGEEEEKKVGGARGGKRKRGTKKEAEKKPAAAPRAKRPKKTKPQEEPEYFEDKRNLEDLWKAAFPVGTEWEQLDSLYEFNWDFRNLEEALEEGGKLYGKKVFVFGCSEPQLVPYKDLNKIVNVPAVVAIESPFPPSDKIGITSIQREVEEIVQMKKMKMDWVPYIPFEKRY